VNVAGRVVVVTRGGVIVLTIGAVDVRLSHEGIP
jgi:hypothetical protein